MEAQTWMGESKAPSLKSNIDAEKVPEMSGWLEFLKMDWRTRESLLIWV